MTTLAVGEAEIAAEGSLAGVTRRTRLPTSGDEVLRRGSRAHLTRLRCSGRELVTVSALESLPRAMLRMTERVTKRACIRARGFVRLLIVAHATRSDLAAAVRFAGWRVARVAVAVRREICGNRKSRATIHGRAVTTSTTIRRTRGSRVVLCVIEVHVELLVEARGKTLQRWITALRVGMTDQTHRDRGRSELATMAVGARLVPGETRRRGVVHAFVAGVAGKGTMLGAAVKKF